MIIFKTINYFAASIIFIWVVGYFFVTAPNYLIYDETVEKYIFAPGTVSKHRYEGYGYTLNGKYGIKGIQDITEINSKKIIIWGDSYIEALHVNDDEKTPQIITRLISERQLGDDTISFGVGMSGNNIGDYYFDIPKYESFINGILGHYILITNLSDVLPDMGNDDRGKFTSKPLSLHEEEWRPQHDRVKKYLYDYKLYFIREPLVRFVSAVRNLDFIPSKNIIDIHSNQEKVKFSKEKLENIWQFLFIKLRNQTKLPITFVYAPHVPAIRDGLLSYEDESSENFALFTKIAKQNDINVIDASDKFRESYKNYGKFPRGFPNSFPGAGHFNKNGHRIVAELIVNDFFINGGH